jgi:dGTP triphosphohydrolase
MGFEVLWDGFDKVCEKAEKGEEFTKTVIKYMEKRHEIEQKYGAGLGKMNSIFSEREDGTTKECWSTFGAETAALAQDRGNFVADIESVIQSLKQQMAEDRKTRLDIVAKGKKLVKDLANSDDLCSKARTKYVTARKNQQKSDEKYKALKVKGVQKNIEAAEKALKKDKEVANAADDEYRKTVIALAKHQDKYYTEDMPALLKEFESFERARILSTKRLFAQYCQFQAKLGPSWSQNTDRFQKKVESINPDVDLNAFVSQ